MSVLAGNLLSILVEIVSKLGYGGVLVSTALEYACFPISSEILLPFMGYTASKGDLTFITTVIFATIGGVLGSLACFFIGRFGKGFFRKFMKYKGLRAGMESAKKVFDRYGKLSVFFARVFPIARTYVSIPAGASGMNVFEFMLYTAGGAFIWNTVLIGIGYALGENYMKAGELLKDKKELLAIGAAALVVLIFLIFRKKRKGFGK